MVSFYTRDYINSTSSIFMSYKYLQVVQNDKNAGQIFSFLKVLQEIPLQVCFCFFLVTKTAFYSRTVIKYSEL